MVSSPDEIEIRNSAPDVRRQRSCNPCSVAAIPDRWVAQMTKTATRKTAGSRTAAGDFPTAAAFLPASRSLSRLREAAGDCRGCPLYKNATQTVFGEGARDAELMLVGETPGDQEDRAGHPFVGPAGRLLDEVLEAVGIDRRDVFVTNAVKHFKWEPRGKRRLHKKPSAREAAACRPWFLAELEAVEPHTIVCLGATAAQALLGRDFRLTRDHGKPLPGRLSSDGRRSPWIVATWHPSAVLRAPTTEDRTKLKQTLIADLRAAVKNLKHTAPR
jgi:DNA polymerase